MVKMVLTGLVIVSLSLSLSDDGNTIAIGAPYNDGNGTDAGHARVYKYDSSSGKWTQVG